MIALRPIAALWLVALLGSPVVLASSFAGPRPSGVPGRIAVFPAVLYTDGLVDATLVDEEIRSGLERQGLSLISYEEQEVFFDRNRVRWIGGVDRSLARALREEEGVGAVFLPTFHLLDEFMMPRVGLTGRLVTADDDPRILWMDTVVLAGDDHPGAFELHVIRDPDALTRKAVGELLDSLRAHLDPTKDEKGSGRPARRHRPRELWIAEDAFVGAGGTVRVAVVPFTNQTGRRHAGDMVQILLVEAMVSDPSIEVIEPGVTRQFLLDRRIIPARGVSLPQADSFREALEADWVVSGNVFEFEDGAAGTIPPARAAFSITGIDARSRTVAVTAFSGGGGRDGVILFDRGRIRSASAVASALAEAFVHEVTGESARRRRTGSGQSPGP